jgi:phospholipase C
MTDNAETADAPAASSTPAKRTPLAVTRRRLLSGGAVAAGAAAALALPPNVRKAVAATTADSPRPFNLSDVKHVVILMQENRSFDHYFGTLSGVRGFADPTALKLSDGKSVFYQADPLNPDGYLLPYHLDTSTTAAAAIPSTNHSWAPQHQSYNDGAMDGWMEAHIAADGNTNSQFIMGYYNRGDLPFHYALADHFTICDNYYCGVLGPTYPNRILHLSGTIDPTGSRGGPIIDNGAPYGVCDWECYPQTLDNAGVSWRYYQDNQDYNYMGFFPPFYTAEQGSRLYDLGMASYNGKFEYDAMNDQLPTVSWIATTSAGSEHPNASPAGGANFIASKLDAVAANPDVWAKTVFIINYDENDGLFDHVPPPVAPAGTPGEIVTANSPYGSTQGGNMPVGPGFRVPCIIVSPWTTGGFVCSTPFDHTSVLRFLETVTGVPCPNISAWRRQTLGDLTTAFGQRADPVPPSYADTGGQLGYTQYAVANFPLPTPPSSNQAYPVQEPGRRPHIG